MTLIKFMARSTWVACASELGKLLKCHLKEKANRKLANGQNIEDSEKRKWPKGLSAPALELNTIIFKHVYWYMQLISGERLQDHWSSGFPLIGIDNKNLYTYRQGDDTFSDIDIPSDYCASLAMKTNGSLFDSTNTLHGAVRHQRHFMQTVGDRIGLSASHSQCQECSCELDVSGAAVSVCRRCDLQPFYMKVGKDNRSFL